MKSRGFTFIEVLISIGIIAVLLVTVVSLYFALAHARMKQQVIAEVEEQGQTAMTLLLNTVRNAHSVTSPTPGTSANSLTLVTYATSTTPTVFSVSASTLFIVEDNGLAIALTSPHVVLSNLTFQNLSNTNTLGSLRVQFTLSYASSTRQDSNYSTVFYGAATVRRVTR
ncbi:MAG: prepilin-type N-terminal cleavage/methylation domain-containing protein [bacterium]|nr:prepilin-type N-terminal cleavage/methylation domain-containing protein [bacterium]